MAHNNPHSLYHFFPMDDPLHSKTRRYIQNLRNSDDRFVIVQALPSTCAPEEKEFIRRVRARSLPPQRIPIRFPGRFRSPSPPPLRRTSYLPQRAYPSVQVLTACVPKITRYYPEYSKPDAPHYSYLTRMPGSSSFTPTPRLISNIPHSYGPKHLTGCSTFPTMRHSSYSLLEPIERYRYHTGSKTLGSSSSNYLGYPTPTTHSSSAYRVPEVHPSRFQLGRINEPSLSAFHAGRRTLY